MWGCNKFGYGCWGFLKNVENENLHKISTSPQKEVNSTPTKNNEKLQFYGNSTILAQKFKISATPIVLKYRIFSNRGATPYRGAPLFGPNLSGFLDVFGHISAKKMVRFSICKKPLEGEIALSLLIVPPKGFPRRPVPLLGNLRYALYHDFPLSTRSNNRPRRGGASEHPGHPRPKEIRRWRVNTDLHHRGSQTKS